MMVDVLIALAPTLIFSFVVYPLKTLIFYLTSVIIMVGAEFVYNDIREMSDQVREIVTNKALIAINQDPLGKAAKRVRKAKVDVLAKPLADGSVAVCFFNKTGGKKTAKFDLNHLLNDEYIAMKKQPSYHAVEQWSGEELDTAGELVVNLEGNASKVFIVR